MSIFISIASYKDPETIPTILDCYNKAKNKDDLHFGVLLQEEKNFSDKTLLKDLNVDFIDCDWRDSRGACWARHTIQRLLFNREDYYLQLDSHHRFCENWDEWLINGINSLKKFHKKPIIGGYCPGYKPTNSSLEDKPMKITSFPEFTDMGDLMFRPKVIKDYVKLREKNIDFVKARFLSGHFIFSESEFLQECPYDPLLYFRGEELSLSARAYTYGYDFFHPTKCIVWHEYIRSNQTKHWDDHTKTKGFLTTSEERSSKAKQRVRQLLGMENSSKPFQKYGLGNKRSLHEYELYAGLNFSHRLIHKYAFDINNDSPQPYIMSEADWSSGMLKQYTVEFSLPNNYINDIKSKGANSFAIVFYQNNDRSVYRKDIKKENFLHYNTNIVKITGNMEEKPQRISILTFFDNNTHNIPPQQIRSLVIS